MTSRETLSSGKLERRRRYRAGLRAEAGAVFYLRLKGYRILARRWKTPVGEIDIIALRGGRIAFVEVKRRKTFEAAEASITPQLRRRVRRAADIWLSQNSAYQRHCVGFDLLFLVAGRWPRYLQDCL